MRRFFLGFFLGVVCPLSVFSLLAVLVVVNPDALRWDTSLMLAIHPYANPWMDRVVAIATRFGTRWGVIPASLILIGWGVWQQRWRIVAYLSLALGGTGLLNTSFKALWHRARPSLWEGIPVHGGFSFPSGHAMASMSFVAALILLNWNNPRLPLLMLYGGLFVVLIGWTRLYLGVHFPSDILAGWMLSIAWVVAVSLILFWDNPAQDSQDTTE